MTDLSESAACLSCGKRLPRPSKTVWGPGDGFNPPTRCSGCSGAWDDQNGSWEPDPEGGPSVFRCTECGVGGQHGKRRRRVLSRTPKYDKPGGYGDGHFCGLRCGYRFGVAMANSMKKRGAL